MTENEPENMAEGLLLNLKPMHRYQCPKGHEWDTQFPYTIRLSVGEGIKEQRLELRPCLLCIGEFMQANFPVQDIGEVTMPRRP